MTGDTGAHSRPHPHHMPGERDLHGPSQSEGGSSGPGQGTWRDRLGQEIQC